jgi:hypothetical protein
VADGVHVFKVEAFDNAGNRAEQEVVFEVGPVPALVHIEPHQWNLSWSDPFDNVDNDKLKDTVTAAISLENMEIETIVPTFDSDILKNGDGYGNFVIVAVVAASAGMPGEDRKIRSLTLEYVGDDEIDVLAFSGSAVWDFYDLIQGSVFTIDAGERDHLSSYTTLSSYKSDPPLYSSADIIPDTIRLNGRVPIIAGSDRLITEDSSALDQPLVLVEVPYEIVQEKRHHVWLSNLGDPQNITLEVGDQTIFEDEPYPLAWHDNFSLQDDDQLQIMWIHASDSDSILRIFHHNLQAEARIYLDGALALTIRPEAIMAVLRVDFNPYEAISTIGAEALERGADWLVTPFNGATLEGNNQRRHITVMDIGSPQRVKLVVGDEVVIDNAPFPMRWSDRCFMVAGQRQDMSIKTYQPSNKSPYLSINCRKLTHEASLYLDDELIIVIEPPPEVAVWLTGDLELDGDPATFDGAFRGVDEIEFGGKLPKDFDLTQKYQRIETSGEPALQIGDRFGDFEIADFAESYDDWRMAVLAFRFDGSSSEEINFYEDSNRNQLLDSFLAYPGDYFSIDVEDLDSDCVFLEIGNKHDDICLSGNQAAEIGDSFLDCTLVDISMMPFGPPHYTSVNIEYTGSAAPISIAAFDESWKDVIDDLQVDPDVNPVFTIDASGLPNGYLGENLVLEFGQVE